MAWQDDMVLMLRILINDMDQDDEQFTDMRLEQLLSVGAQLVYQELDFDTTYTIGISPASISPDPSVTATKDDAFMNMTTLKAACLADLSEFRTRAALAGLRARAGPATLSTIGHLDGYKELLDNGPCAAYDELKNQWMFGNGNICQAILSPFISNDFNPANLGTTAYPYLGNNGGYSGGPYRGGYFRN